MNPDRQAERAMSWAIYLLAYDAIQSAMKHTLVKVVVDVLPERLAPAMASRNILSSHRTDASARAEAIAWLRFLRQLDEESTDAALIQTIAGEPLPDEEEEALRGLKEGLLQFVDYQ